MKPGEITAQHHTYPSLSSTIYTSPASHGKPSSSPSPPFPSYSLTNTIHSTPLVQRLLLHLHPPQRAPSRRPLRSMLSSSSSFNPSPITHPFTIPPPSPHPPPTPLTPPLGIQPSPPPPPRNHLRAPAAPASEPGRRRRRRAGPARRVWHHARDAGEEGERVEGFEVGGVGGGEERDEGLGGGGEGEVA